MNKKILIPVIVVIILLAAGLVDGLKGTLTSSPTSAEPPAPTATPTAAETPAPAPTATPESASATSNDTSTSTDTSSKVEVSPGVYSDGTVRQLEIGEWDTLTQDEKQAYLDASNKANGFGSSMEDLGGEHITDEELKDFMDETWNLDNPYIQDILNSGVLDN